MKCEKCGTEYESGVCPNGCGAAAPKKKKPLYKKWWFWVLMGIATIILLSVVSGGGSDSENNSDEPKKSATSSITETAENAETEEDNIYEAGEGFEANGLNIKYIKAEKWESKNQFLQPKDGNVYIRLFISAENTSSYDRFITYFDFDCYADGIKADSVYIGDDELNSSSISKGRKAEGYIYFEVPANAKDIEVEYETSFWSDKKAILKVKL